MTEDPPKKPRGRPRVDAATKAAKAVARATAYRERKRTDHVELTIWIPKPADEALESMIIRRLPIVTTKSEFISRLIYDAWVKGPTE